jgi:hypothetical protein
MQRDQLQASEEAEKSRPLFAAQLLKATHAEGDDQAPWQFEGIASDEAPDLDGDAILKKTIDLTYAQQRGFVNWDHSRLPEDQIGYLTSAEIIPVERVRELKKTFPEIRDTASIYVTGELYRDTPRAQHVQRILKSLRANNSNRGLGLSVDGALARDLKSGGIVKAYVRGVAITAQPMHPNTLLSLKKSVALYNELDGANFPLDLLQDQHRETLSRLDALLKTVEGTPGLDHDQAVLFVLKQRPHWTLEIAQQLVDHTKSKAGAIHAG